LFRTVPGFLNSIERGAVAKRAIAKHWVDLPGGARQLSARMRLAGSHPNSAFACRRAPGSPAGRGDCHRRRVQFKDLKPADFVLQDVPVHGHPAPVIGGREAGTVCMGLPEDVAGPEPDQDRLSMVVPTMRVYALITMSLEYV
jgi:hypothetical protein